MARKNRKRQQSIINNTQLPDSSSKLIFGDNILSSQFFRDYADMEILRKIQPEDIEDVSERYVPLYASERESDTVKKVNISRYLPLEEKENGLNLPLYIISLVEHKTKVEYNVGMQILRYMIYIWEDYEKEMLRQYPGISGRKDFRYPPILPIVYYEGTQNWTAPMDISERILCGELLGKYLPRFQYQLVKLHDFSNEDLLKKGDEISLAMLINKIQRPEDVSSFVSISGEQVEGILKDTPEYLLETMAKLLRALLYKMNLPEEKTESVVSKIKERKMARLFENVKIDIQEEWRKMDEKQREIDEKQREMDEKQREIDEKQRKIEEKQKEIEETKKEARKEVEEANQALERYIHISRLLWNGASEAEIEEALVQKYSLSKRQAEAELQKVREK